MAKQHLDVWSGLQKRNSVMEKLRYIHEVLQSHMPFVSRVAVALYDVNTDYLRTYAFSSKGHSPLNHYHAKLAECRSLKDIAMGQQPRLVQDLSVFNDADQEHSKLIYDAGYRSSYTLPLIWDNGFLGFVFFNSDQVNAFNEKSMTELDVIGHLITLVIYNEIANIRTLLATLKSALDMTHSRDPETGGHLERMSRYARLIAKNMAAKHRFDDQFIEHVFLFAPLHDLGKLTVPDSILLKEGPLDDSEFKQMSQHSEAGKKLIDRLLENYGLNGVTHIDMLRNIVLHHHESLDGRGYPDRLAGEDIPIEARIVAVADIFDALTSKRPYKEAWSNERAVAKLQELAGVKLDAECVDALLMDLQELNDIQKAFLEDTYG